MVKGHAVSKSWKLTAIMNTEGKQDWIVEAVDDVAEDEHHKRLILSAAVILDGINWSGLERRVQAAVSRRIDRRTA